MGVFTKNDNYWIDFRDQYGRRHRRKVGKSKKLAERVYAKVISEVAEKRFLDVKTDSKITFAELAEAYREHIQHRTHFRKDNNRLKQLEAQFGNKLLVEITTHEVEKYRQQVTPRGKIAWNRLRAMLHRMFELGKKWQMCEHNPVSAVERYKESAGKTRFLSPNDELPRVLEAAQSPEMLPDTFALIVVAIFTGLRRSEQFRLRWVEVDFDRGIIHVNRLAKSRRSREVPMVAIVREVLLAMHSRTGQFEYVFCTQSGKPYKDRRATLAAVLSKANIEERLVWHDMRHCFASYLAMAGVDLLRIRELLGHSDFKMTLRYAHLSPSFLRDSVQRLDALMPGSIARPKAANPEQASNPISDNSDSSSTTAVQSTGENAVPATNAHSGSPQRNLIFNWRFI